MTEIGRRIIRDQVLIGQKLAESLQVKTGDTLSYRRADGTQGQFVIAGIVSGGGNEDNAILASLPVVQQALNLKGKVSEIEVSAITTPENDLARKAAANPERLSQAEREIWYCTAYVSSIAFQIEEVVNNSSARPVRQIAESEGKILDKTQLLMLLITVLSLISAALGVSNLVSANVMERSREIGLMKALGAKKLRSHSYDFDGNFNSRNCGRYRRVFYRHGICTGNRLYRIRFGYCQ